MADVFRGPLYTPASRLRKPMPVASSAPNLLLSTLAAVVVQAPFNTAEALLMQPLHSSHNRTINADTSAETPKTLYSDAVPPVFEAPHLGPQEKGRRSWLPADTSLETPKTLYTDAVAPVFNPPHFGPNQSKGRNGWLPADTSQETPKALYTDAVAPFSFYQQPQTPGARRIVEDSTAGTNPLTFALPVPPFVPVATPYPHDLRSVRGFLPEPQTMAAFLSEPEVQPEPPFVQESLASAPTLRRVLSDGTAGVPDALLAPVVPAPIVNPIHVCPPRFPWLPQDASEGTPKVLYGDALAPFSIAPIPTPRYARDRWLPDETSSGVPKTLYSDAIAIPDVVGLSQANATTALEAAGFVVSVTTETSNTVAAGLVINQVPTGGTLANSGSTVTIAVSLGAPAQSAAAGSKKRRHQERYVVKHGDRYEVFSTPEEVEEFIEAAQAVEAPKLKKQRRPIRIELAPAFVDEVSEYIAPPRINKQAPPSVVLEQIRRLEKRLAEMERQRREEEEEDDEVLLWLM